MKPNTEWTKTDEAGQEWSRDYRGWRLEIFGDGGLWDWRAWLNRDEDYEPWESESGARSLSEAQRAAEVYVDRATPCEVRP